MNKWLLTDEERNGFKLQALKLTQQLAQDTEGSFAAEDVREICEDADRAMLQAQDAKTKRELVKWLEPHFRQTFERAYGELTISVKEWQALRKEVGLEVKE